MSNKPTGDTVMVALPRRVVQRRADKVVSATDNDTVFRSCREALDRPSLPEGVEGVWWEAKQAWVMARADVPADWEWTGSDDTAKAHPGAHAAMHDHWLTLARPVPEPATERIPWHALWNRKAKHLEHGFVLIAGFTYDEGGLRIWHDAIYGDHPGDFPNEYERDDNGMFTVEVLRADGAGS